MQISTFALLATLVVVANAYSVTEFGDASLDLQNVEVQASVLALPYRLNRKVPNTYGDRISTPRAGPAIRGISNTVFAQPTSVPSARKLSSMVWQWGQFLDHDLTVTPTGAESVPISIPANDPFFAPQKAMGFSRSQFDSKSSPREQQSFVTPIVDASQVYGSTSGRQAAVRGADGFLATSFNGKYPPLNSINMNVEGLATQTDRSSFHLCGDVRCNEQVVLLAAHTIWVREHNRIVTDLKGSNPALTADELFNTARRRVAAAIKKITYEEWLPAVTGRALPAYNPASAASVDADKTRVFNEFSTAAFRLGHTMVAEVIPRVGADGKPIAPGHLSLRDGFFQPQRLRNEGGVSPVMRGLAQQCQEEIDSKVIDGLRNFLFGPPGSGGFDLVSFNIARGREHGIGTYAQVRAAYGLSAPAFDANTFADQDTATRLFSAYSGNMAAVDLWVGLLSEKHVAGGSVGPTLLAMLEEQFTRLRDNDPQWYELAGVLSAAELADVKATTWKDIIVRNTAIQASELQSNVFFTDSCPEVAIPAPLPAPRCDAASFSTTAGSNTDFRDCRLTPWTSRHGGTSILGVSPACSLRVQNGVVYQRLSGLPTGSFSLIASMRGTFCTAALMEVRTRKLVQRVTNSNWTPLSLSSTHAEEQTLASLLSNEVANKSGASQQAPAGAIEVEAAPVKTESAVPASDPYWNEEEAEEAENLRRGDHHHHHHHQRPAHKKHRHGEEEEQSNVQTQAACGCAAAIARIELKYLGSASSVSVRVFDPRTNTEIRTVTVSFGGSFILGSKGVALPPNIAIIANNELSARIPVTCNSVGPGEIFGDWIILRAKDVLDVQDVCPRVGAADDSALPTECLRAPAPFEASQFFTYDLILMSPFGSCTFDNVQIQPVVDRSADDAFAPAAMHPHFERRAAAPSLPPADAAAAPAPVSERNGDDAIVSADLPSSSSSSSVLSFSNGELKALMMVVGVGFVSLVVVVGAVVVIRRKNGVTARH